MVAPVHFTDSHFGCIYGVRNSSWVNFELCNLWFKTAWCTEILLKWTAKEL